jgi:hypothetical protein
MGRIVVFLCFRMNTTYNLEKYRINVKTDHYTFDHLTLLVQWILNEVFFVIVCNFTFGLPKIFLSMGELIINHNDKKGCKYHESFIRI